MSTATPPTSRTRSHVSRSSECLRKHFGFLILNAIFSQMKCQIKKIFSGFLKSTEFQFFSKKRLCVIWPLIWYLEIYLSYRGFSVTWQKLSNRYYAAILVHQQIVNRRAFLHSSLVYRYGFMSDGKLGQQRRKDNGNFVFKGTSNC